MDITNTPQSPVSLRSSGSETAPREPLRLDLASWAALAVLLPTLVSVYSLSRILRPFSGS